MCAVRVRVRVCVRACVCVRRVEMLIYISFSIWYYPIHASLRCVHTLLHVKSHPVGKSHSITRLYALATTCLQPIAKSEKAPNYFSGTQHVPDLCVVTYALHVLVSHFPLHRATGLHVAGKTVFLTIGIYMYIPVHVYVFVLLFLVVHFAALSIMILCRAAMIEANVWICMG